MNITAKQLAARLGVSLATVYALLTERGRGLLPVGPGRTVDEADLDALIREAVYGWTDDRRKGDHA